MSQNKKLIPKRRFREFEGRDEWKTVNLKDVADTLSYGLNAAAKNYDGYNKYLRITDIADESREFKDDSLTSPDIDLALAKNYKLKLGDILFARTGASVGKTYHYKESDGTVYYAGFLICLRLKSLYSSDFIYQNTLTKRYKKFIQLTSQRSGQPGVNAQEYSSFVLAIPNFREQIQIGEFFKKLDNLIQTQQKKSQKAKTLKSAYLAEMFPSESELKPQLRFKEFSQVWETYQLGEVGYYRRGSFPQPYGYEKWYNGNHSQPFVQVVDVTNQLKLAYKTKQRISKLAQPFSVFVPSGKIVVTLQGSIGRVAITQYDSYIDRTLLVFENFTKKINLIFWAYTIQQIFEIEKKKAPGGTIKTITKEALSSFYVSLPTEKEQTKIGNFFKLLDQKIALEQRKLDKLNNIKHAYLNEMFV